MNASIPLNRTSAPPSTPPPNDPPKPPPNDPPWDDPKNWIPLKEAAHLLHVSRRTVVRMCETADPRTGRAFLRSWRPTRGTLMLCRRSLQQFCQMTQSDPDFWWTRGKENSHAAMLKPMRRARGRNPKSRL